MTGDIKTFLRDMAAVRSVNDFLQVFGLQKARQRGVMVAREWVETTRRFGWPDDYYLLHVAENEGWPAAAGDWRWHTYVAAANDELDRLAGRELLYGE
jgi:hypothetical protein